MAAFRVLMLAAFENGNRQAPLLQEWLGAAALEERVLDPFALLEQPDFSVLVPVRGAHGNLAVCLRHLARIRTQSAWEVVLVCPGAEHPDVYALCREHLGSSVRWAVYSTGEALGYPAAVNHARLFARGANLVTLNSDAYVPSHLLDTFAMYLHDAEVVAVAPAVQHRVHDHEALGDAIERRNDQPFRRMGFRASRLIGFCLCVRAWAWNAVGGLDESYGLGNYDDDDLSLRLSLAGTLLADTGLVVGHSVSASFAALGQDAYRGAMRAGEERYDAKWGWLLPAWSEWITSLGARNTGEILG
jgi:GT2 family glycosyltransferase